MPQDMNALNVRAKKLLVGLGTNGARLVERFTHESSTLEQLDNFRVETRDLKCDGLDAYYRFDEVEHEAFNQLLEDTTQVLLVTCAGSGTGSAMARFVTLFARSKNIPVNIVMMMSPSFEGYVRRARSRGLYLDLKAMGAVVDAIDGDNAYADKKISQDQGYAINDEKIMRQIRLAVSARGPDTLRS